MVLSKLFIREIEELGDVISKTKNGVKTNDTPLSTIIFSLISGISNERLLSMSDEDFIEHIRETQQFEAEN